MPTDSLQIVQNMGTYRADYKQFCKILSPQLQTTAVVNGDYFTSHGFDHCMRILQEIDNLFYNNKMFYEEITSEEIYCIGLAVLLHDLVMTKDPQLRL